MSKGYMPTRTSFGNSRRLAMKDRSCKEIVQKKAMTPRQFWAHVAKLPLR